MNRSRNPKETTMKSIALIAAAALALSATASAADDGPTAQQKARQGMMRIMALNMGVLGGMAKGEIPFNSERATIAANTLTAVGMIDQSLLWPAGSGMDASKTTDALPAIWEKPADFNADWVAFGDAAKGLVTAAGADQAALGQAMGKVGGTCTGCHDDFREKQD
jgi:cytochrome c556